MLEMGRFPRHGNVLVMIGEGDIIHHENVDMIDAGDNIIVQDEKGDLLYEYDKGRIHSAKKIEGNFDIEAYGFEYAGTKVVLN